MEVIFSRGAERRLEARSAKMGRNDCLLDTTCEYVPARSEVHAIKLKPMTSKHKPNRTKPDPEAGNRGARCQLLIIPQRTFNRLRND